MSRDFSRLRVPVASRLHVFATNRHEYCRLALIGPADEVQLVFRLKRQGQLADLGEQGKTLRPGPYPGSGHGWLERTQYNAFLFVLMNVDDLSHVIHFDCDLSADSDIPEHAALGSEDKTLLPSRRRQRHLGLAIINRCERSGDETRPLAGLPFRTRIHDHVAFVDPERHFITDFGNGPALDETPPIQSA